MDFFMNDLQIESLTYKHCRWPVSRAANAHQTWVERCGLEICVGAGGYTGWGEASPLPGYSNDTLASATHTITALDPKSFRIDSSAPWSSIVALVQRYVPVSEPAVRFALETALANLMSQILECSFIDILGGQKTSAQGVAELVADLDEAIELTEGALTLGAEAIKLKVGRRGQLQAELEVAKNLKDRWPQLNLRLDANQAFVEDTPLVLKRFDTIGFTLFEEPGPPSTWLGETGPAFQRIALDESLRSPEADMLLDRGASQIGAVVLKPVVLGGLSSAINWSERAANYGIPSIVSHTLGGPIEAASLRSLSVVLPHASVPQGLGLERALGARVNINVLPPKKFLRGA